MAVTPNSKLLMMRVSPSAPISHFAVHHARFWHSDVIPRPGSGASNSCCFPTEVVAFSLWVTQWRWERARSHETEEGCSAGDSRPHGTQNS